ncbi:DddA-like double-stranded DNA deaminase toxin [Kutzneria sp. NPDC051319]|uniref:DddA-like double-stranded DNA deaminase toxin n=1 Tax=Kutzneria sp. NPDC051319 TaxID=3155047 RepID=UPI00341B0E99
MANVGEVLSALGAVAGCVDRAARVVATVQQDIDDARGTLTDVLAGSAVPEAEQVLVGMAAATECIDDVAELLGSIAGKVTDFVERIRCADAPSVPPGARAARSPVAGRTHPTNVPPPPVDLRDREWAAHVGAQLTEWKWGKATEALVFDTTGQDWQVNSGVDAELTAAARAVVEGMIRSGEVGASSDPIVNHGERTALRQAVTHAETKAAVWAAAKGKEVVDVVTNRDFVCGQKYVPGDRFRLPGCVQAIAAILPAGYSMRVWRRGVAAPFVIAGRGEKD